MDASATALGPAAGGPAVHRASLDGPVAEQGGANVVRPALPVFLRPAFVLLIVVFLLLGGARLAGAQSVSPTPPGSVVRNVASVEYALSPGKLETVLSNEVSVTVEPPATRAAVRILRAEPQGGGVTTTSGPTACRGPAGLTELPPPVLANGQPIDPNMPAPFDPASLVHGGEAVFFEIADGDQNRDASLRDTIDLEVTSAAGDRERLQLVETGPDSGLFVGYIQTSAASTVQGDCVLQVLQNAEIVTRYADPRDATDTASASALVDPSGLVFDSQSGAPVDGARVRLVDAATGQLATVVGDDGVSAYPAEVVTGAPVTDAGGTVYTFPPGVYRFPLVPPGTYRIEVTPPGGYTHPSTATLGEIALLPGAPFRVGDGSFRDDFVVSGPLAAVVDVPLDPAGTALFLTKRASTTVAAPGDFVQYTLALENASASGAFDALQTTDRLPPGMRYRAGSSRLDGEPVADPAIEPDGRTLRFATGRLEPGARIALSYVAEVTVAARGKELVNVAQAATPDGLQSNEARASIRLREELNRSSAIVVGRVVQGSCDELTAAPGVAGVRVYLEDGRYAVTDAEGKYHFEGLEPGTHVVQLDTITVPDSLEPASCADNVRHAGRRYSQFVDLRGGALWRADFALAYRPLPNGSVALELATTAAGQDELEHVATLRVQEVGIAGARLLVMLPAGVNYLRGSARLDDARTAEPSQRSGVLTFDAGTLGSGAVHALRFQSRVAQDLEGELAIKAVLQFDSAGRAGLATQPVANLLSRQSARREGTHYTFSPRFDVLGTELDPADRARLDAIAAEWQGVADIELSAIGHSDRTPIAAANRDRYPDNHALSRARAAAVADYLGRRLGLPPEAISIDGRGADEPVADGDDPASLARNRRVEISIIGVRTVSAATLSFVTERAAADPVTTVGARAPGVARRGPVDTSPLDAPRADPATDLDVERLVPGIAMLAPASGEQPAIPSLKVALQHRPSDEVVLTINGRPVSRLNYDGAEVNAAKTVALSRWRGIDLREGDNELVAVVRGADGSVQQELRRSVHYAGGAVRAELDREQSVLVADGRTRPVLALRMLDAHGKPARGGTLGTYRVEAPYRSWWEVQSLNENKALAVGPREPTFTVDDDGIARLELEPTAQAGTVVLRLRFSDRQDQEVRAWLAPEAREWIVVGIAEGSAAYRSISQNMEAAEAAGLEDGMAEDGRVAFFAKGRIRGEFLLTIAYDSARDPDEARERLFGVIEPDRYYTLYGDGTEQRFEAASSEKLFLKLERQQFYALFGDFDTGLTVTELSRYSRNLTGFRSEFAGERIQAAAFVADSALGYVKDELRGDGTSGLYRLSGDDIVINSDRLRLEVRDRFRSEVVVESRPLTRFIDYDIDYLRGTVFFKQPVPSRDDAFNPVWIIAEYEVIGGGEQTTAGGRIATKLAGDRAELGATLVEEGAADGPTRLGGLDLRVALGAATELRAELARSESDDPARPDAATAYLAEIQHLTERLDARAYLREQQAGFGVGQQLSTEGGTRKAGIDGRLRFGEGLTAIAEVFMIENLDTGAERRHAGAELRREADNHTLAAGLRRVEDTGTTTGDLQSDLAFVQGSVDLFGDRVTLRAASEFALGGRDSSVDYPARTTLGLDYHLHQAATLFAEYEHADGAALTADMTRVGVRATPWNRAQLTSALNQEFTEFGPRVFANLGLTQGWQVNERLAFDVGVDQSNTLRGPDLAPFDEDVPLASGTLADDFLAAFVGGLYRTDLWTANARVEHRNSDLEERWALTGGLYREPVAGHAFSAAVRLLDSSFTTSGSVLEAGVDLGWAFRPVSSRWIVLNRLELEQLERDDQAGSVESARVVNNLNANWQLDPRTQLGLQLGLRYVASTFDGERYDGLSDLYGVDLRRDLSRRFDVGLHGTWLHSWRSGVSDAAFGVDVGVTLARNLWLSVGYNFAGFDDDDFDASRYTAQGPFIKLRMKADQDTFKDLFGLSRRTTR